MEEAIRSLQQEISDFGIQSNKDLEAFRLKYTVRKGLIADLFGQLKTVAPDERPRIGQLLNTLKKNADEKQTAAEAVFSAQAARKAPALDLTLPGRRHYTGSEHPVQKVLGDMKQIFHAMGFSIATGPELELDRYNFDLLNFPPDHPARDMQDTFFITRGNPSGDVLLRTHTSPVQVRVMLDNPPPIRVICPGKVYRNEAISSRSYCVFHQLEGLYIDKNVSFADLKATIFSFARQMFGKDVKLRFRPSFFPFTEPSAEVDVTCYLCGGKGCRVCKKSGWLEIMGCGMVHPNVMRDCGIDPEVWSGYAFGMGVDRTVLLRYKIDDIRLLFENDIRMLRQFPA
ncbi:MAG: phenylalanine--tRNA ligase subunit alpha [Chlorobium limicola]|jgi:phenylalanyl-tRNA synthetase alpha chain|uniref:Phenylalanine--tRNA ligase alpha subunit n=1 Tax=Chlorobium limicola (strain DSM 245 / NBRC 103803 / 6330) TaxID=290315 RepID=SYFA_CHLL2|nr:phenylalanine--tRNA ligase subunit alpha [Chlorobium limicola]B3EEB7.1 RecName: Full=Phenylalanine--tRNA ligase alpha subunit; AltName: Full=Phenylalanyl-tRNA synthetase alpha subunit; Short=PheRS [Chlorobium limicola DSM 245]ACD89251.1 phenylalanyl-tRNA synthetase, alpha subunit [Chlorobium limicola DSM 245]NTV07338.1 phenylalanine--tRNA ligase subunit alpha [Chlorobium limicola]NTV21363.1 phenylalanine--tRNA ligase subunit alpha [Chlorobium limicola]